MKKLVISILKIWHILFLGGLLIFLTTNCSQDQVLEEVQSDALLKAQSKFPKYEGNAIDYSAMVNDDYIEIVIPEDWNGIFIVYAHGYVNPTAELALPTDEIEGIPIKNLITNTYFINGYFAYASTSYSENGFAVKEAVNDIKFLGNLIKAHYKPTKLFLGGVSEGGLVAMKMLEREDQDIYDAGLVVCGPIGNFQKQLQYFGDFHVLFNFLFADEIQEALDSYEENEVYELDNIGSPKGVPVELMQLWDDHPDLFSNIITSQNIIKLILLTNYMDIDIPVAIPAIPDQQTFIIINSLVKDILRFNIMATNDMIERVHGVPYDNTETTYINYFPFLKIEADKQALHRVELLYETSGSPNVPVVIRHTTGDHITPIFHYYEYLAKTDRPDLIYPIEKEAFGHCNFTIEEITEAIGTMVTTAGN